MEIGEKTPKTRAWSVLTGPSYDATLHLPSQEAMDYVLNPDHHTRPETKLRIAAGGTLMNILELLHPDLHQDTPEAKEQLKELRQETGKSIMYSSRLGLAEKQEVYETYSGLQLIEPPAAQALRELREKGLDSEVAELAEWGLMVLAIKETDPEIKLPTPTPESLR